MKTSKNLPSFKAIVTRVDAVNKEGVLYEKTRANGTKAPYLLCQIKFTEGPASGKSFLAQRSLVNRDGVAKDAVAVNDEVFGTLVGVVNGKPFLEVTTSINGTDEDLLSAFGATTESTVAKTEEVEIPLEQ